MVYTYLAVIAELVEIRRDQLHRGRPAGVSRLKLGQLRQHILPNERPKIKQQREGRQQQQQQCSKRLSFDAGGSVDAGSKTPCGGAGAEPSTPQHRINAYTQGWLQRVSAFLNVAGGGKERKAKQNEELTTLACNVH